MEWNNERTIEFIKDYQKHPFLWHSLNVDYKNRMKRKDAIDRIGLKYHLDSKSVLNKIKGLRSYFHREHLNIQKRINNGEADNGESVVSSWFAYPYLTFIIDGVTEKVGKEMMSKVERTSKSKRNEDTGNKNNKRQKFIYKQKEETKEPEVYDLLELVNRKRKDQCAIFGELIASKLRSLSPPVIPVAQHKLLSILLEFEIDHSNVDTAIHYIEQRSESPDPRANDENSLETDILTEIG